MNKYNKKQGVKNRESQLLKANSKLKRDYDFMNHFQLEEFFTEHYLIEESKNRENLKTISEKLIYIDNVSNK